MSLFKKENPTLFVILGRISKYLCVLLALVLLFSSIQWQPFQVHATQKMESSPNQKNNSDEEKEKKTFKKYNIVSSNPNDLVDVPLDYEIVEKRDNYSKTFRKIDGTYEVAIYNKAVHYLENGKWKDIDNNLVENENSFGNKANQFKIKLPKKLDDNKQIKLKMDDYQIDWNLLNINQSDIVYEENQSTTNNLKELINLNQSVLYQNIQDNVDIEYVLTGSDIKENIILNDYVSNFSLSFEYKLKNLEIIQDEDGQILFINETDEVIYTFSQLYMYDQNDNISYDVNYQIEEVGNKVYQITITPDNNWLENASYPVIIDPTLKSDTTSMRIYDTYISKASPYESFYNSPEMKISESTVLADQYKGLLYFYIPEDIMDEVITYSRLTLTKNVGTIDRQINLYKNLRAFSSNTVTWNSWMDGTIGYDDTRVIDYHIIDSQDKYIFDITKAVKEWQATGNNRTTGFTICNDDDDPAYNSVYQMGATDSRRPVITIGYEEPAGLKDYWTYTSQDMGMLGTSYISDYTGNLTFVRNDFSMDTEFMSLSLDFFFNNYERNIDIGYGNGWRTSFDYQIKADTLSGQYYVHKPDGSKVYFVNGKWNDFSHTYIAEDGSRMELLVDWKPDWSKIEQYEIVMKNDIVYRFLGSNGQLKSITNTKTNHALFITYVVGTQKIDYVVDEAGHRIDFGYDSTIPNMRYYIELKLKQSDGTYNIVERKEYYIETIDNNIVFSIKQGFDYDTDSLMDYNHELEYTFNSEHKLTKAIDTTNDYQIQYEYDTNNKVDRVITKDGLNTLGELNIQYLLNKTIYTDHEGKSVYYTFDYYGHTVNVMDDYGNSTFYKYSGLFTNSLFGYSDQEYEYDFINLEPNYYNNHQLLYDSSIFNQKQQLNQLNNHGFENRLNGWIVYPDNTEHIGISNNEAMLGSSSLYIENSNDYVSQDIELEAGSYSVVAWIKTDTILQTPYIDILQADYKNTSIITDDDNTVGWKKYYVEFTLETNKIVTIRLINQSNSTCYFDNIQIVNGFIDVRYNNVIDNSFESGLDNWLINGASQITIDDYGNNNADLMEDILGQNAISIIGDGSERRYFEQDINHSITQGDTFVISGWAKADAVPNKSTLINNEPYETITRFETNSDGRFFGLKVIVEYESEGYQTTASKYLTFDPSISDWQYQTRTFTVMGAISSVKIQGIYQGEGTAYFDNIQLYNDEIGSKYSYDDEGKLTNVESKRESTSIEYDEDDKVRTITSNGITTNIERNDNKQIEEVSRNNVTTTFEYDSQSNQLIYTYVGYDKEKPLNEQDKWFRTSTTYTTDDQYVSAITDEFGNTTNRVTDPLTSLITTITDALDNTQTFNYDDYGNIDDTTIETNDGDSMNVDYIYYPDGKLWKIDRDGFIYELIYNDLDQIERVKIESTNVMSYDYVEKVYDGTTYYTDLLESQTYGNGDSVSFEYNDENQVKIVKFNNEIRSEYEYDSSGRLAIYKDNYGGDTLNTYFYSYDLTGRLETITDKDGNKIRYAYDDDGNVSNYTYEIEGISRGIYYYHDRTTGEYNHTYYKINNSDIFNRYNYDDDSLRRLNDIELSIGSNILTKQINYVDDENLTEENDITPIDSNMGNATNRVTSIIYKKNGVEKFTYKYRYDANNNIKSIKVTQSDLVFEQYDYWYDGFNQLIREDVFIYDSIESYTKYYEYDSRGNITDIIKYAYKHEISDETPPSYYQSSGNVKMYYNGFNTYEDTYYLAVNSDVTEIDFTYYDTSQFIPTAIYGMETTLTYTNLDISTPGYYYSSYIASDGWSYSVSFKIVYKVGIPLEHLHFNYSNTWLDKLTGYDKIIYSEGLSTQSIQDYSYDNQGNPTTITNFEYNGNIYHHADLEYDGRELTKIIIYSSSTESTIVDTITYRYNDQGIRVEKTTNTETTKYVVDGDRVLVEKNGTDVIYYTYDADGSLLSMNLNGTEYFYITNMQGDVIELVDMNGNIVVSYKYDAWGNIIDQTDTSNNELAEKNPYRYRGYRYDEETGWYYLNSRYYNPEIGRFINADGMVGQTGEILSHNMYAYTSNNPVMRVDPSGYAWYHWAIAGAVVVGLGIAVVATAGGAAPAIAAVVAAANGVASASMATTVLSFAFVGASGALATSALMSIGDDFEDQGESAMWNTFAGGGFGALGGFLSHKEQMSTLKHSWSTEAKRYWKSQGYDTTPKGSDGESMVLHHPYGRYGSKIKIYYPMTRTDHTALHKQYGYGNGKGGFYGHIDFSNPWDYIRRYFGG